ncbi:hypothetical protein [Moorena producens]|uniref:hypothetical protein n=1 Tax=Moorena producens TaxID=1155739 RepID=UPI003C78F3F0
MRLIPCFNAAHRYSLLSLPCSLFPVPCSLKSINCVPHKSYNCYSNILHMKYIIGLINWTN